MSLEGKKCPQFLGDATGGAALSNKDFVDKNLIIFSIQRIIRLGVLWKAKILEIIIRNFQN